MFEELEIVDFDGDGNKDLILSAPNDATVTGGGGAVGVFLDLQYNERNFDEADLVLYGASSAGSLGTALAVQDEGDLDGDGFVDVVVSAPYSDFSGWTGAGQIYKWSKGIDFIDVDQDGFVDWQGGGVDCVDSNSSIFPSAEELLDNKIDDDCDGWVDDLVMIRPVRSWWVFEGEARGIFELDIFDFESGQVFSGF